MRSITEDFNEQDLYITYGGLSQYFELKKDLYWHQLIFNNEYFGYTSNKALNLLIDNVINKATL